MESNFGWFMGKQFMVNNCKLGRLSSAYVPNILISVLEETFANYCNPDILLHSLRDTFTVP